MTYLYLHEIHLHPTHGSYSNGNNVPSPVTGRRWCTAPDERWFNNARTLNTTLSKTCHPCKPSHSTFAEFTCIKRTALTATEATFLLPSPGEGGAQHRMRDGLTTYELHHASPIASNLETSLCSHAQDGLDNDASSA